MCPSSKLESLYGVVGVDFDALNIQCIFCKHKTQIASFNVEKDHQGNNPRMVTIYCTKCDMFRYFAVLHKNY